MSEKELLDMMIAERIDMLLRQMPKNRPNESREVSQLIKQAEQLLQRMPQEEWVTLTLYMDHQTDRLADEGTYLYTCGITDGIRLMNYIARL